MVGVIGFVIVKSIYVLAHQMVLIITPLMVLSEKIPNSVNVKNTRNIIAPK